MKDKFLKPKIVSFKKIEKLWETNRVPTQIYIHSAFCESICKFCIYKGGLLHSKNSLSYNRYFNDYLPSQWDKYSSIISKNKIQGIYFGGGTPNTEEDLANLKPIFDKMRNVDCVEKTIELHFGLPITDKTIEVLAKEKFNTALICIQTFNKDILKEENRVSAADNNLDEIIGKLHQSNINVGIDLIIFKGHSDQIVHDVEQLMLLKNKPDEITILHQIEHGSRDFTEKHPLPSEYRAQLIKLTAPFYKGHVGTGNDSFTFVKEDKVSIFDKSFFSFRKYQMAVPDNFRSLIGIGSLKTIGHRSYSKIGRNIYFENYNVSKNKVNYTLYTVPSSKEIIKRAIDHIEIDPIFYDNSLIEFKIMYITPEFTDNLEIGYPNVLVKYQKQ